MWTKLVTDMRDPMVGGGLVSAERSGKLVERLYPELVEFAPDAMIVTDETSEILLVNRQAEILFGYARAELVGQPLEVLLPERFRDRYMKYRGAFASMSRPRLPGRGLELCALHQDGREFPVEISLSRLATESGVLVASAIRDVAQRRTVEEDIQKEVWGSELRYLDIFARAGVGITRVALDGRFLEVNEQACRITGYTRAELMRLRFRDITHPDDLAEDVAQAKLLAAGEIEQYQLEKRYVCKDGAIVWVNLTASVSRGPTGEPLYLVGIFNDITTRKQAEARIRILVQAGRLLGASLDYEESLQNVASLMVPELGDWCFVDLVGVDGRSTTPIAVVHEDPEKRAWARALREQYPVVLDASHAIGNVIRTGRSALFPVVTDAVVRDLAPGEAHLHALEQVEFRSVIIVPLKVGDLTLGTVSLAWCETNRSYDEDDVRFVAEIASRAALTVNNAWLLRRSEIWNAELEARVWERTQQVRELASEVTLAEARERGRIARLLHDDLQQQLYVIQAHVHQLRDHARANEVGALNEEYEETTRMLKDATRATRTLASDLNPVVLESDDFLAALRWLSLRFREQHDLDVEMLAPDDVRVANEALRGLLFSLVRECLFNVVKHADVQHARVIVRRSEERLEVEVVDEGRGFDPATAASIGENMAATGFGLKSAAGRLELFGGTLCIVSQPDGDETRIVIAVPFDGIAAADGITKE